MAGLLSADNESTSTLSRSGYSESSVYFTGDGRCTGSPPWPGQKDADHTHSADIGLDRRRVWC